MSKVVAIAAILIVLLGGCGGGALLTPSGSAVSTPSPTMSVKQLGTEYLTIAAALNKANCTSYAVFANPKSTLAQLKKASASFATALRAASDGLRKLPWPPDIAGDARALIKILATTEAAYALVAGAKTRNGAIESLNEAYAAEKPASGAGNLLRGDLGVKSVSVPC